jgi:hypothetical protein
MIELTAEMKAAALRAERDFEAGKCFSEADFKGKQPILTYCKKR